MEDILNQLAMLNYSGAPFLIAYGITWNICGWIWKRSNCRIASLATLFQGMIALPIALFLMYLIGAFNNRPDTGIFNSLIIIIAMSQLLVLPLLISMFRKRHYTSIPFVFSSVAAVHFLMYTWMYQTFSYTLMAILIVISISIIYGRKINNDKILSSEAAFACFSTGSLLLLNAIYLIVSHIL